MKLPIQITFRDIAHSNAVETAIRKRAERLDHFHNSIISCRVVVEEPHRRHQTGNHFRVRVDLKVPDGELVTERASPPNGMQKDVYIAIRDAFAAMERQLKSFARRHRVRVHEKGREAPAHGRVIRLIPGPEAYGFLRAEDGREVYFHQNSVLRGGFDRLRVGEEVRFAEAMGDEGLQASTVEPVGRGGRHVLTRAV
ncbi:MAG: HPF/RaiA family ribosome-associated protein [Oligoflexia bacterium]|nr:HPF/RaiA family ribosome-associated protein [Oligoflexia bacterium]